MRFQGRLISIGLQNFVYLWVRFTSVQCIEAAPRFIGQNLCSELHEHRLELIVFPRLNWDRCNNTYGHDCFLIIEIKDKSTSLLARLAIAQPILIFAPLIVSD